MVRRSEATELSSKPPITGWSTTGRLTTPIVFNTVPLTYQRDGKGIAVQAKLSDSEYYSVEFGLTPPPDAAGIIAFKAIADVLWTVQGNSIRRRFSVQTGTVISGTGELVNVTVADASETGFGTPPVEYTVAINIAKGQRPSTPQPPTFFSRDIISGLRPPYQVNGGGNILIPIPQDIGINQFMLAVSQFSGSSAIVGPNDLTVFMQSATFNYDYFNRWLPLPPGDVLMQVNNNTADIWFVTPIWGVEG